ncbi:MAG: DUF6542 domain-containing protein, partial [Rhodococcus sp. (in: high G+C Gram-positive bacteria)]
MSTSQRARSGVPLDQRSALATVPGVPAWGAVAIAVGATFLGFVIDAARGTELTSAFACFYIIGVVAAVVLVRYRGLFTALVQAPLILFVAVPLSYQYFTENPGTGLKDILLNVAIPLVNRFPLMLLGTVLALAVGAARVFAKRQASHAPATTRRSVRDKPKPESNSKPASKSKPESKAKPTREREQARVGQKERPTTRGERRRAAGQTRGERSRSTEPAARSRRAGREQPPEGRRARRERDELRYDRPAANPYRPDRDTSTRDGRTRDGAVEQPRRPAPRPQPPRVP